MAGPPVPGSPPGGGRLPHRSHRSAPPQPQPSLPGGVLAAALWLLVSAGFSTYATTLGAYSRLYGSLSGSVVFLVWLWLSNLALLSGAQFAAELSKGRAVTEAVAVPE